MPNKFHGLKFLANLPISPCRSYLEMFVKIADYTLAMQTSHERMQQHSVKETLRVWVNRPAPATPPAPDQVSLSVAAKAQQAQAQNTGETGASEATGDHVSHDPKLQLLISLIERMTGRKVRLFDPSQLKAIASADIPDPAAADRQPAPGPRASFGVAYDKIENYSESEQTTLQAAGIIKTSDGKEIRFSLELLMQRQYSETSSTSVRFGDAVRKDPLVINFSGTAAQLSEQRFAFDLDSDGRQEQINFTSAGSGFLALDLNNDGKINNGSELFGPTSGNGYNELASYDSDGNGWIDENDGVYRQLRVWRKDTAGQDSLSTLASTGTGAISLHAIATPFDIKNAGNQLLASVRSSSVALNENGSAGTVQQIDLTV